MSYVGMVGMTELHPLYSGSGPRDEVRGLIAYNFRHYKAYPLCRTCSMDCKMPNVPGLELKACPKTLGYKMVEKIRGGKNEIQD